MSYSPSIDYTQNDGLVYHISAEPDIAHFQPRPIRAGHPLEQHGPAVWAVGPRLLHNYFLPRDCPRVTFYAGPETSMADRQRFLGATVAKYVVAIESRWFGRAKDACLWLYVLPAESFTLVDPVADYWLSAKTVTPAAVQVLPDPLTEMTGRRLELRLTPSLWPLFDGVVASSLCFSCIRMANASPR